MRDLAVACLRGGAEGRRSPATRSRRSSARWPGHEHQHDYFDFRAQSRRRRDAKRSSGPEGEDDPALFEPVLEALKTVQDPEIPVNLVELGLIYELLVKKGGIVFVEMTLTTPACPVAQSMPGEVETAIAAVPGVNDVRVKLVWTPPWDRGPDERGSQARTRADVAASTSRAPSRLNGI